MWIRAAYIVALQKQFAGIVLDSQADNVCLIVVVVVVVVVKGVWGLGSLTRKPEKPREAGISNFSCR